MVLNQKLELNQLEKLLVVLRIYTDKKPTKLGKWLIIIEKL